VRHCYLPYDLPGSVRRFLDRIQPQVAIILETEIWPTLYDTLGRRGIPLVMASARYRRARWTVTGAWPRCSVRRYRTA